VSYKKNPETNLYDCPVKCGRSFRYAHSIALHLKANNCAPGEYVITEEEKASIRERGVRLPPPGSISKVTVDRITQAIENWLIGKSLDEVSGSFQNSVLAKALLTEVIRSMGGVAGAKPNKAFRSAWQKRSMDFVEVALMTSGPAENKTFWRRREASIFT
jgi:hypothetical protein